MKMIYLYQQTQKKRTSALLLRIFSFMKNKKTQCQKVLLNIKKGFPIIKST